MLTNKTRETLRKASLGWGTVGQTALKFGKQALMRPKATGALVGAGIGALTAGEGGRLRGAAIGAAGGATAGHFLAHGNMGAVGQKAFNSAKAAMAHSGRQGLSRFATGAKAFGKTTGRHILRNPAAQAGIGAAALTGGAMYGNRKYTKVMNNPLVRFGKGIHNMFS